MTIIESPKNARVKEWRKLHTRKGRLASGCFLIEGPHLVEEALAAGAALRAVIVRKGESLPSGAARCGAQVFSATEAAMRAICEATTPQGMAAVCAMPGENSTSLGAGRYLLLDGVQDPGNLGTLIRTADAAGLDGVVVGEGCADPFAPKVVRATQGSLFHLEVRTQAIEEAILELDAAGVPVYGTGLGGGVSYRSVRNVGNFGLVVGNEGAGVRPEVLDCCTGGVVTIPMPGRAESLSVAIAAGIVLFHFVGRD